VKALRRKDGSLLEYCCREVNYLTTIGAFFRRDFLMQRKGFDERYILIEDAPFFLQLMLDGISIGYLDTVTCIHRSGGISNSQKISPVLEEDSRRTLAEMKYPNRDKLQPFTRRVVILKYYLRMPHSLWMRLKEVLHYPDAAAFLAWYALKDSLFRKLFL